MYLTKAEKETYPRKKAQYYQITDQLLQASAGSYTNAKHPEKSKEVRKLSGSIEEKRQLAVSLTKIVDAPPAASATTSFSLTTPDFEEPVGLERFAHANIRAYVTSPKEITVGEELEVRLDLINVGKSFGLLVRIDDLIPQGFRATELFSGYRLEDGSVAMKGKRLDPTKVESVKILMEATEAGLVELCPTIVYTDEIGKFWTCKSKSVQVTVRPPLLFKFKTDTAERAFHYLVQAFNEDYMKRRLFIQEAVGEVL